jgi:hypothetical protein
VTTTRRQGAERRVVLQQVRERGRVRDVVDADDLDVALARDAEEAPADPPESVDAHPYRHGVLLRRRDPIVTVRFPSVQSTAWSQESRRSYGRTTTGSRGPRSRHRGWF